MKKLITISFVLLVAHLVYAIITQRIFAYDGAAFFCRLLFNISEGKDFFFFHEGNHPRFFVEIWRELLPGMLAYFNLTSNVYFLSILYGITSFTTAPAIVIYLYILCKKYNKMNYFFFPLASYILFCIPGELFIVSESFIALMVLWIALITYSLEKSISHLHKLFLTTVAIFCFESYELNIFIAPVVIYLIIRRILKNDPQKYFLIFVALIHSATIPYMIHHIMNTTFSNSFLLPQLKGVVPQLTLITAQGWMTLLPIIAITLFIISYFYSKKTFNILSKVVTPLIILFLSSFLLIEYLYHYYNSQDGYYFRLYTVIFGIPTTYIFALYHTYTSKINIQKDLLNHLYKVLFIALFFASLYQIYNTYRWTLFKKTCVEILHKERGILDPSIIQVVGFSDFPFFWPPLSFALQGNEKVRSIFYQKTNKYSIYGLYTSGNTRFFDITEIEADIKKIAREIP